MKKSILSALLLALSVLPAAAQVSVLRSAYNNTICSAFGQADGCTDADVQAQWCTTNNKPAGAMCAASDTRAMDQRVFAADAPYQAYIVAKTNQSKDVDRMQSKRSGSGALCQVRRCDKSEGLQRSRDCKLGQDLPVSAGCGICDGQ